MSPRWNSFLGDFPEPRDLGSLGGFLGNAPPDAVSPIMLTLAPPAWRQASVELCLPS